MIYLGYVAGKTKSVCFLCDCTNARSALINAMQWFLFGLNDHLDPVSFARLCCPYLPGKWNHMSHVKDIYERNYLEVRLASFAKERLQKANKLPRMVQSYHTLSFAR